MRGFDRSRERVDGVAIAGIENMDLGAALHADFRRGGFDAFFVLVGANDGGAERGQRLGGRLADAGRGAEDERRLAVEAKQIAVRLEALFKGGHYASLRTTRWAQPLRPCSAICWNFFTLSAPA